MSAAAKYTLGRIGLFLAVVAALWPVNLNIFLRLILALAFSAALSFFLLRGWRDEMARELASASGRRRAEKERLRRALAGEEPAAEEQSPTEDRAGGGDDAATGTGETGTPGTGTGETGTPGTGPAETGTPGTGTGETGTPGDGVR